jgi:hypothetical protein
MTRQIAGVEIIAQSCKIRYFTYNISVYTLNDIIIAATTKYIITILLLAHRLDLDILTEAYYIIAG